MNYLLPLNWTFGHGTRCFGLEKDIERTNISGHVKDACFDFGQR
jgi:hypothetical protein